MQYYIATPEWTLNPRYQELKQKVQAAGLLKKTPLRHLVLFAVSFSLVLIGLWYTTTLENTFAVALMAFLIAFPRSWVGYIGHDLSHGQVFIKRSTSYAFGVIVWNLLTGIRMTSWEKNHHPHHYYTNKIGHDPDVDNPFVFSDKQGSPAHVFAKVLPKFHEYQHLYFFLLLPFIHSVRMLKVIHNAVKEKKDAQFYLEAIFLAVFVVSFVSYAFYFLGLLNGAVFLLVNYGTVATIAGLAFAPNHKGQPMLGPDEEVTYKTQVISSRNLRPHPITDFLYGGLNYQIEHHLFTEMSRFHYRKAKPLIMQFCREENLPYHETSPLGSLKEMYDSLRAHAS